jgi:hypothetical protein
MVYASFLEHFAELSSPVCLQELCGEGVPAAKQVRSALISCLVLCLV